MSQDAIQTPHPARKKCAQCGLINAASDEVCRRCKAELGEAQLVEGDQPAEIEKPKRRSLFTRITWIVGMTSLLLVIFYASLLISSNPLNEAQHKQVRDAVNVLWLHGFDREAFVLSRLASFRSSDNWLNAYVGHRDAYAATNFPFEIVTLYPEFFEVPVDDNERAAMLLHEARHLLGEGEDAALKNTWERKRQLGWTAEKYSRTRIWNETLRLTKPRFPYMFQCGTDSQSDCY